MIRFSVLSLNRGDYEVQSLNGSEISPSMVLCSFQSQKKQPLKACNGTVTLQDETTGEMN